MGFGEEERGFNGEEGGFRVEEMEFEEGERRFRKECDGEEGEFDWEDTLVTLKLQFSCVSDTKDCLTIATGATGVHDFPNMAYPMLVLCNRGYISGRGTWVPKARSLLVPISRDTRAFGSKGGNLEA